MSNGAAMPNDRDGYGLGVASAPGAVGATYPSTAAMR